MSDRPSNADLPSDPEKSANPPPPPPYSHPSAPGPYGSPGPGSPVYGSPPAYGPPGYGSPTYGPPGHGSPAYGPPGYGSPMYGAQPPMPKPDNYLVWAVLSLFFCCMPVSIVAVVYAAQVDGHYTRGDYAAAEQASQRAKKWAIASAATVVVGFILWFVLFAGLGLLGMLSSSVSDSGGY